METFRNNSILTLTAISSTLLPIKFNLCYLGFQILQDINPRAPTSISFSPDVVKAWKLERSCFMFFFLPDHTNSSHRNHIAGAFYDFLVAFCLTWKMHYVWRMLVVYFKNDTPSFRGQGFPLQVISVKLLECLKTLILDIFV